MQPQVETPVFSPADGIVFDGSGEVTITCATEGASIYYTTDGTTPTASSTPYTSAITLDKTTTITAIAIKDGMDDSELKSVEFIVKSAPEFESNKRYEVEIAMSEKDGTAGYGDAFYSYYTDKAIITTDDSKNPTMEIEFIYRGTYEGKLTDISIYDATTGTNETTVTYTDNPPNGDDYTITGELTGTASFVLPYLDANGIYYGKGTINALPSYSATEKTDAVHDVELTVDWGTIKEVLDPVSAPVFSQPNGHTFEDSVKIDRNSIELEKCTLLNLQRLKQAHKTNLCLLDFLNQQQKSKYKVDITFRNMVMPDQLQDFVLKGSGEWTSAVKDGDRTENGVTSAILNLELTAHNDKISYTQDLSIFDLYFWNLAIEEPEELQKVLGKETIDSVSDYKTFRQANLPSFDAEAFDNSILGDKNSYVRDYEIEITIEKLIGDNWVELSNEVLYGGEDAK